MKALIFDFDGLILDTELPAYVTWQAIYQEHGCHLPRDVWVTRIGNMSAPFNPMAYLEEQLGRSLDRDALVRGYRRQCDALIARNAVLPGVEGYIGDAKQLRLKLGIASSSPRAWVTGHLTRLGLRGHFDTVQCGDDVARGKPEPDLYDAALGALSVEPDEAIAFEDSQNGLLAAKRAGVFCVAVPNPLTRHLPLEAADVRLSSLADLPLEELLHLARSGRAQAC
ncbi:MAG: HAD family hydrolase [Dehalococcoidia bacterium]|nr:HAD family hydrolase [Dehalococcoidia bacterium]